MDRLERITALFHRRWSVPLLAELHRAGGAGEAGGAKFVTLVYRTGASEGAVRQTLAELVARGWVARNSGYGHPLRPEYILTRQGAAIAPACAGLDQTIRALGIVETALRRWSMPVLHVLGDGPRRFGAIARSLEGITDRSLALTLRDLDAVDLVARRIIDAHPPASAYETTRQARPLLPALAQV